jgi:hypothetical protein
VPPHPRQLVLCDLAEQNINRWRSFNLRIIGKKD